ncbi:hypothetical protein [Flavivirga algicola]|uniref:Lipoprotein n=1 Tax=Flavivirga algicola TaxID=2729136 RepID=A0ABX1RXB3_9FLAO|nr:hypothetical protein [Flavivirga algicola]NMH87650.1 hypothetical protein [Flavivirga algicola]
MKTILYVFIYLFIGANLTSCTPQDVSETGTYQTEEEPDCCGDGGNIPPPPPDGN